MNLIDEAVIIEIFGIRMYAFGTYIAVGALFYAAVLGITGRILGLKKGTVSLAALLAGLCGMAISRIVFCLLNQELGQMTPLFFWPQLNGGGWSMFGLICGIWLGGLICSKIMKEIPGRILDALSLAMLPLIAAERFGENRIEDFDISRPLDSVFLQTSFLAVGEDEPCLATYYVAAAVAAVIFVILACRLARKERAGTVTITFLLLFGAASIITESLRYDRFLSITFVGLQQIAAALMLAIGVILSIRRSIRPKSALSAVAVASIPLMVGAVIGLEFALDRTNWNKLLIYLGMIIIVGLPAILGLKLLSQGKGTDEA